MSLSTAASRILKQLAQLVNNIEDGDFARPSATLNGSSLGQHIRHTMEFFLCYKSGFEKGVVNYDQRNHDRLIETDRDLALAAIRQMINFVDSLQDEKPLKLEVGYDLIKDEYICVDTNSTRELLYNMEHAVHHMAIMKIGLREIAPYVRLEDDFGIAASTIRYASSATPSSLH
jgi:uncharacterized damage-inducible protein DinB